MCSDLSRSRSGLGRKRCVRLLPSGIKGIGRGTFFDRLVPVFFLEAFLLFFLSLGLEVGVGRG